MCVWFRIFKRTWHFQRSTHSSRDARKIAMKQFLNIPHCFWFMFSDPFHLNWRWSKSILFQRTIKLIFGWFENYFLAFEISMTKHAFWFRMQTYLWIVRRQCEIVKKKLNTFSTRFFNALYCHRMKFQSKCSGNWSYFILAKSKWKLELSNQIKFSFSLLRYVDQKIKNHQKQ